jgi:phosphate-selective porin OprO/OprP
MAVRLALLSPLPRLVLRIPMTMVAAALPMASAMPATGQTDLFGSEGGTTLAERTRELGLIYRNPNNPVMQEAWILGRYHGQYHWTDATTGEEDGYEDRRFRFGGQARFFGNLTVHAQAISGSDFEPAFNGFTELWLGWRFSDAVTLTVGQQKHRFTHDRNVSSRYLQTLERGLLTNMFNADYTPAVTLSGQAADFTYYGGVFSNYTDRDVTESMFDWESGYSLLATATRDVGRWFQTDSAHLNVSLVHSEADAGATNLNWFDDGLATALILTDGPSSWVSELTAGLGADAGDAYGLNVQPGYFFTSKLQLVGRYQLAFSDGDDGLLAQHRRAPPEADDRPRVLGARRRIGLDWLGGPPHVHRAAFARALPHGPGARSRLTERGGGEWCDLGCGEPRDRVQAARSEQRPDNLVLERSPEA